MKKNVDWNIRMTIYGVQHLPLPYTGYFHSLTQVPVPAYLGHFQATAYAGLSLRPHHLHLGNELLPGPVLPTLCRTFRLIQKKNSAAEEKISIPK